MAENAREKKSSKIVILIVIMAVILLALIGVVIYLFLAKEPEEEPVPNNGGIIQYEAHVVNYEDAQRVYDEMQKRADEGTVDVSYVVNAYSEDGVNFTCDIENPVTNDYDMYLNIYKDADFKEQILLTGLIPPGSGIKEFESEIPLDPGEYKTVLVMTLVEDDHSTLHGQSKVYLNLHVDEK